MDSKQIRYLLNYDEDYIADQLSYLPKEGMDESALQAYLGNKKYGKDGMDALRKAGRDHAGKEKMQNIRAKFSNKEDANENFINMDSQAVTTEDEMDEGNHTQQDRDLNPNDYERSNTDWSRDPIEAGSDRIHQKISSMLKRLEKPKSPQHDKRDTDIGSVLEAALPWEDEDEEDKDDKKTKDTKGSDGSEHGGHSRAKHLAKQAIPKEKEEVNEMDKSQTPPGRDGDPRPGPDKVATPITKEKMVKHALDTLTKSTDKEHKKEVKEGQDDLDRILQIMNHRR